MAALRAGHLDFPDGFPRHMQQVVTPLSPPLLPQTPPPPSTPLPPRVVSAADALERHAEHQQHQRQRQHWRPLTGTFPAYRLFESETTESDIIARYIMYPPQYEHHAIYHDILVITLRCTSVLSFRCIDVGHILLPIMYMICKGCLPLHLRGNV